MATRVCGWCGARAVLEAATRLTDTLQQTPDGEKFATAVFRCPGCGNYNVARERIYATLLQTTRGDYDAAHYAWGPVAEWTPRYGHVEAFPDVPGHIASAASEATLCFSVGAYRAVGSLARAVLEATVKKEKAGTDHEWLNSRIDKLTNVSPHTKEQAHEIRIFGNDMAHGDFTEATTEEEAAEVLSLMTAILRAVYQEPEQLKRLKSAREAKKKAATPPE